MRFFTSPVDGRGHGKTDHRTPIQGAPTGCSMMLPIELGARDTPVETYPDSYTDRKHTMSNQFDNDRLHLRAIEGDGPLDHLLKMAHEHGCDEGPEAEIGDLNGLLNAAWEVMPTEVRAAFLQSTAVMSLMEVSAEEEVQKLPYLQGQWEHIFGHDTRTTMVRFVLDCAEKRIEAMQIKSGPTDADWIDANADQVADVEDSVVNANEECLQMPDAYGLEFAYVPPAWASHLVPISKERQAMAQILGQRLAKEHAVYLTMDTANQLVTSMLSISLASRPEEASPQRLTPPRPDG
jgi:hypothetical protein